MKKNKQNSETLYFKVSPVKESLPVEEIINDVQKFTGTVKNHKVRLLA